MSTSPAPKRAKTTTTTDENVVNALPNSKDTAAKETTGETFDYKKWFDEAPTTEKILDRWFATDGNLGGGRTNFSGDWVGEFDEPTDWSDFEACLAQVPRLAEVKEGSIPIIRHVCHVSDPPVPVSAMRKLIELNPSLLAEKFYRVSDPNVFDDEPYRNRVSVLVLYLLAPSFVIDGWDVHFEVCKLLIEAEPKLLFYHDNQDECGKRALIRNFPEQGKKLLEDLSKTVDLDALEKEVKEHEENEEDY